MSKEPIKLNLLFCHPIRPWYLTVINTVTGRAGVSTSQINRLDALTLTSGTVAAMAPYRVGRVALADSDDSHLAVLTVG